MFCEISWYFIIDVVHYDSCSILCFWKFISSFTTDNLRRVTRYDEQQFLDGMMILTVPPLKSIQPRTVNIQSLNDISPIEQSASFHLSDKKSFASVKRKLSYFLHEQNGPESILKDHLNEIDTSMTFECDQLVKRYLLCKYCPHPLQQLYTTASRRKMAVVVQLIHSANALFKVFRRMKTRAEVMIKSIIGSHISESKFLGHCWALFLQKVTHGRVRLCFGFQAMSDANLYVISKVGSVLFRLLRLKVEKKKRGKGPADTHCRIRQLRKAIAVLKATVLNKEDTLIFEYEKRIETMAILLMRRTIRLWCGEVKKRIVLDYAADFNDSWILTQALMRWRKRSDFTTSDFQGTPNLVKSKKDKPSTNIDAQMGPGPGYSGSYYLAAIAHQQKIFSKYVFSVWHKISSSKLSQRSAISISIAHEMQKMWNFFVCTIAALKRSKVKRELRMFRISIFTRKVGLLRGWEVLQAGTVRRKASRLKNSTSTLVRRTSLLKTAFKGLVLNNTEGNLLLQKGSLHSTVCMKGRAVTILLRCIDISRSRREKGIVIGLKISKIKLRRSFQRMMEIILVSKSRTEMGGEVETARYIRSAMTAEKAWSHHNSSSWQKGLFYLKENVLDRDYHRQEVGKFLRYHQQGCLQLAMIRLSNQTKNFSHWRKVLTTGFTEPSIMKKQIYFKRLLLYFLVQVRIKRGKRASLQRFCNLPFQQWMYYAQLRSPLPLAGPKDGRGSKKCIV